MAGPAGESSMHDTESDRKIVYWHRDLPPIDGEPAGEYLVEADSVRVVGGFTHDSELWDRCYRDLMAQVEHRLGQEVHRLGGSYAHALGEEIESKHDNRTGEVWLHGRIKYLLLRRVAER